MTEKGSTRVSAAKSKAHAEDRREHDDDRFAIRDLLDSQLETSDKKKIGRVADVEGEWHGDAFVLTHIVTGPQALAGRVGRPLRTILRWLFRDRFEHRIPMSDLKNFGATLHLRQRAEHYPTGQSERWIARYILRWIPGSGYADTTRQ